MIEKVLTGSDVEIVNLYKTGSHAPYTPLEKGNFGYLGVLLARKTDGKVQCHVCGGWYITLGSHITKHKEVKTLTEYKHRFGFPVLFPLCSFSFSERMSKSSSSPKQYKHLARLRAKPDSVNNNSKKEALKISRKSGQALKKRACTPSYLNTFDICHDQTIRRVRVVSKHLGHFPSVAELRKHDSSIYDSIRHRYGTWNNFKKLNFPNDKIREKGGIKYSSDYLLFCLREFKRINKKSPIYKDFSLNTKLGIPRGCVFQQRFGSWSRALSMAGLQINPKETKTYRKAG